MAARALRGFSLLKNAAGFVNVNPVFSNLILPRTLSTTHNAFGKLMFSENHEYLDVDDNKARIGITDHAQKELGDVVYVELPEVAGQDVEAGEVACSVESVKAVAEVYYPVSGKLLSANDQLTSEPGLVNSDPYKDGWLVEIELTNLEQLDKLMDEEAYNKYLHDAD